MKLQQKVILAQLPLGLIIGIIGFLFVFTIGHIGTNTNDILVSNYKSIVALQKMRQSLDGFDNTVWKLSNRQYNSKGQILYVIDNYTKEFETQLNVQKSNIVIDGELESTVTLENKWIDYKNALDEFVKITLSNPYNSSSYATEYRIKYTLLRDSIHNLTDLNQDDIYYRSEGVSEMIRSVSKVMIVFAIAAFLIGVLISGLLTSKIMSPLRGLTDLVRQITEGKMGVRLNVQGADEVAELGKEFNSMAKSLEEYRHSSIGELVRAKIFLQVAIDTLPDPLIIVNQIGRTLNLNKTARKEFDYTEDSNDNFDDFLEKLPFVIKERIDQITEYIFSNSGAPLSKDLTRPIIASYNYKLVEFVPLIQPVTEPTIGVIAIAIILRNITNIDVKGYIKADKFVSLTHELLLPLNSIHIAIHTCLERVIGDLNSKQDEFLSSARNDCFRIKKMITSLQDLDKLEDITHNTEKTEISLIEMINDSCKAMEVIANSKNISFDSEFSLLFDKIYGNKEQLKLVFNNLIDNAIHHSPINDKVTIKIQEKDKDITIFIHNRGSYIPAEYHSRVFDKFFQMPDDTSRRDGLGLYIAKNIIEQHNGKIGVRSSQRLGTTFWIKIPKITKP